jgi:predicted MPP superfamily phosphohydrolase
MSSETLIIIISACAAIIAALLALVYWYAFRFEPVNFKVSNIEIKLMKNAGIIKVDADLANVANTALPSGFTILHLSDFHLRRDRNGEKLFSFIRSLSVYDPDFIFITGDLVEKDMYFDYLVEMLEGLNAKAGKYAVFGVHDYYNKTLKEFIKNMVRRKREYRVKNDVSSLIGKLNGIGIKVLRNERVSHTLKEGLDINITGLEDFIIGITDISKAFRKSGHIDKITGTWSEDNYNKEEEKNRSKNNWQDITYEYSSNKENTVLAEGKHDNESIKINKDLLVLDKVNIHKLNDNQKIEICLTHTPDMDLFGLLVENGVDIIFSGHTHGGQVRLPGIGAIISGCNIKARYASGLFYFKQFVLYVSRGLGEGRYSPFRFYCQPEATVIKVSFVGD